MVEAAASVAFMTDSGDDVKQIWHLDSCASRNLSNRKDILIDYKEVTHADKVSTAGHNGCMSVAGIGTVLI